MVSIILISLFFVGKKVKDGELLKGISDQANSVAGMVSNLLLTCSSFF
jgi:hypothetical protein